MCLIRPTKINTRAKKSSFLRHEEILWRGNQGCKAAMLGIYFGFFNNTFFEHFSFCYGFKFAYKSRPKTQFTVLLNAVQWLLLHDRKVLHANQYS